MRYIVLSKTGSFRSSEERSFSNEKDARMFKELLQSSETNKNIEYHIAEIIE